jgi:hypothetical protein
LYWKDYYNENDNNWISNINDDQRNITCQDNTIRMSKRHKKPPVTKNDNFFMVKNNQIGNTLFNCNSNNGSINIFDVILSSKISY